MNRFSRPPDKAASPTWRIEGSKAALSKARWPVLDDPGPEIESRPIIMVGEIAGSLI